MWQWNFGQRVRSVAEQDVVGDVAVDRIVAGSAQDIVDAGTAQNCVVAHAAKNKCRLQDGAINVYEIVSALGFDV